MNEHDFGDSGIELFDLDIPELPQKIKDLPESAWKEIRKEYAAIAKRFTSVKNEMNRHDEREQARNRAINSALSQITNQLNRIDKRLTRMEERIEDTWSV